MTAHHHDQAERNRVKGRPRCPDCGQPMAHPEYDRCDECQTFATRHGRGRWTEREQRGETR